MVASTGFDPVSFELCHSDIEDPETDQVYAYQGTLIAMSLEFREQLRADYEKEKSWRSLLIMLVDLNERVNQELTTLIDALDVEETIFKKFRTRIDFEIKDDLIYYIERNRSRLCILKILKEEIFRLAHDDNQHVEAHRCFHRISKTMFISRLLRKIRSYVDHCLSCQVNQTKRHRSYEELMSIFTTSHSFHIIAMNFIVGLLDKYDSLLIITNKFSRRLLLILEYITKSIVVWARKIISDL